MKAPRPNHWTAGERPHVLIWVLVLHVFDLWKPTEHTLTVCVLFVCCSPIKLLLKEEVQLGGGKDCLT